MKTEKPSFKEFLKSDYFQAWAITSIGWIIGITISYYFFGVC